MAHHPDCQALHGKCKFILEGKSLDQRSLGTHTEEIVFVEEPVNFRRGLFVDSP